MKMYSILICNTHPGSVSLQYVVTFYGTLSIKRNDFTGRETTPIPIENKERIPRVGLYRSRVYIQE